jgi:hypothetical protein
MADTTFREGDRVKINAMAYRLGEPGTVTESPNRLSRFTVSVKLDSDGNIYPFQPSELERADEEEPAA